MSFANGAMSAKAKAMYGNRIKEADYTQLIQKRSVADVASYLKHETYYRNTLSLINESSIHRGQLEMLLRYNWFERFSDLLRYADKQSHFYHYIVGYNEIEQIMACLHMLQNGDKLDLVSKMPVHLAQYMSFDLFALAKVESYEQLLEIVQNTPYYCVLKEATPRYMSDYDFVDVESKLTRIYYQSLIDTVKQCFSGEKRKSIEAFFKSQIELDNIIKIYRLKKYYNASSDKIRSVVTPQYYHFSKQQMDEIIDVDSAEQVFEALKKSRYANFMSDTNFMYIEYHAKAIHYAMSRQQLNFSNDPDIVLMSYMVISEIEVENLVDIIEGIRYHIAPDKIASMLIV